MKAVCSNTSRPLVHVYSYMDLLACGKIMRGSHWEIFCDDDKRPVTCKKCLKAEADGGEGER